MSQTEFTDRVIRYILYKLPVVVVDDRIGLAMNGTPSTHILKSSITSLADSVANEHFCLSLAAAIKLPVAKSQIRYAGPHEFLLVQRYDRTFNAAGHPQRLHQEDFCQALGSASETKYQHEGGPDTGNCIERIRNVIRPSAPSLLRFVDAVIFNALTGNHDAHAKNFSLLYNHKGVPSLAPLYDLLSTAVYPEMSHKMAMKIASQYEFRQVMPRHWEQFAISNRLSAPQLFKRLQALATHLPATAHALKRTLSEQDARQVAHRQIVSLPPSQVDNIVELIEQRCALTLQRLARFRQKATR